MNINYEPEIKPRIDAAIFNAKALGKKIVSIELTLDEFAQLTREDNRLLGLTSFRWATAEQRGTVMYSSIDHCERVLIVTPPGDGRRCK